MGKRDHILVSLDIGNGYVKARGPNNISVSYPSLVAEVVENMPGFDFSLNGAGKFVIGYRDHQWAIGDACAMRAWRCDPWLIKVVFRWTSTACCSHRPLSEVVRVRTHQSSNQPAAGDMLRQGAA